MPAACTYRAARQYNYHVKTYGHPSQFGYKDICHIWRAENWNPEELIRLYAKTGAKYFVALGNHHDNFDCWNSKYQPWNCVNVGPKKDIVGTWGKIARAHGTQVRCHLSRARRGAFGGSSCQSGTAATGRAPEGRALRRRPDKGRRQGQMVGWHGPAGPQWAPARQGRSLSGVRRNFTVARPGLIDKYNPGPPLF